MSNKLYVGNISYNTTEDTLRAVFSEDGKSVKQVDIIKDRDTGLSRGFAFITMASDGDAKEAAQALDGREIDGRSLRVNEAQDKPKKDSSFRQSGDRRGGGSPEVEIRRDHRWKKRRDNDGDF
jgi:RNA recognition motif-containing protein